MEDSRYHYLNTFNENYNDNINSLQQKIKIYPKVVYNIGYTQNNIINNDMYVYFFDEEILLKILEQQTIESPDLIKY